MSIIIRYVEEQQIRENFVSFVESHAEIYDGTENMEPVLNGSLLGELVVNKIQEYSLDIKNCVGISTDGCSVMISKQVGAVHKIQEKAKSAIHCPCLNHSLNLSISKSSNVQSIRNCLGIIKEVIAFFRASSKRNYILEKVLGQQLQGLCETRWIERHESVLKFKSSLAKILEALDHISNWQDRDSSSKANNLISALTNVQFIVAIFCLSDILSVTAPLSRSFQNPKFTINEARDILKCSLTVLKGKRLNSDTTFKSLLIKIKECTELLNIDFRMPRLTTNMKNRPNPQVSTPQEYFKISVYIPLLDNVISDLESRFNEKLLTTYYFKICVPSTLVNTDQNLLNESVAHLSSKYESILKEDKDFIERSLLGEVDMWKQMWLSQTNKIIPDNGLSALANCDKNVFPFIYEFLKIYCTLPISVASAERSFSTLRRLKTWIRSKMKEDRLNGLALLHIYRDIDIDVNSVIERFGKQSKRNLEFLI